MKYSGPELFLEMQIFDYEVCHFKKATKISPALRALLQFWSFIIRRTTFFNCIKFVDPRIWRL